MRSETLANMKRASVVANYSWTTSDQCLAKTLRSVVFAAFLIGILSISGCTGASGIVPPSLSPSSINFGSVAVGSTVNQSVTVSNRGRFDLTVNRVDVAVPGFTIDGIVLPITIHPGDQSSFSVVFRPKTTGKVSGLVSVVSFSSDSSTIISIGGAGVPATSLLNASAMSLDFGNVNVGASASLNVTLTNAGNSSVTLSGVNTSNGEINATGVSAGLILSIGQSLTANITFSPLTVGPMTASVTIASDASNSPLTIDLSGSGVQSGSHSVTVSWTPSTGAVAGYNVYRSTSPGGAYAKLNSSLILTSQYSDNTVQSGQTYSYVATSVDSTNHESTYSQQVSVTIPTP